MNAHAETTTMFSPAATGVMQTSRAAWTPLIAVAGFSEDDEQAILALVSEPFPGVQVAVYEDATGILEDMSEVTFDLVVISAQGKSDLEHAAKVSKAYRQTCNATLPVIMHQKHPLPKFRAPAGWICCEFIDAISTVAARTIDTLTDIHDRRDALIRDRSTALSGSLDYASLTNVLTFLGQQRLSGVLSISTMTGCGRMVMDEGELRSAQFGNTMGEMAMPYAFLARRGTFEFLVQDPVTIRATVPKNIGRPLAGLIMDALRIADEVKDMGESEDPESVTASNRLRAINRDRPLGVSPAAIAGIEPIIHASVRPDFLWESSPLICTKDSEWIPTRILTPHHCASLIVWMIVDTEVIARWMQQARLDDAFRMAQAVMGRRVMGWGFGASIGDRAIQVLAADEWPVQLSSHQQRPDILCFQGSHTWHDHDRPNHDTSHVRTLVAEFHPEWVVGIGNGEVRDTLDNIASAEYGPHVRKIAHNLSQSPVGIGHILGTVVKDIIKSR